jgi:hypothetical protein
MSVAWSGEMNKGYLASRVKEQQMALPKHTLEFALLEEAITILFFLIDDTPMQFSN